MRLEPAKVCQVAVACAVLHNLAIAFNEPEEEEIEEEEDDDDDQVPNRNGGAVAGRAMRRYFVDRFFTRAA